MKGFFWLIGGLENDMISSEVADVDCDMVNHNDGPIPSALSR